MGKGTEVWGPESTLLQLIVSIQGLILVAEPYYNEAGYEKQTDTQQVPTTQRVRHKSCKSSYPKNRDMKIRERTTNW